MKFLRHIGNFFWGSGILLTTQINSRLILYSSKICCTNWKFSDILETSNEILVSFSQRNDYFFIFGKCLCGSFIFLQCLTIFKNKIIVLMNFLLVVSIYWMSEHDLIKSFLMERNIQEEVSYLDARIFCKVFLW